jgi:hypothetical protein
VEQPNPTVRQWRDLRLLRISGALLIAALPLAAAFVVVAIISGADVSAHEDRVALVFAYPIALVWMGFCAGGHLGLMRVRGYTTRRQCLVWGPMTGLLAETAFIAITYDWSLVDDQADYWDDSLLPIAFVTALFILAGLLSGWIYWRLGIRPSRPAEATLPDAPEASPAPAEPRGAGVPVTRMRRFFGVMLAALPATAAMVLMVFTGSEEHLAWRLIMVGLAGLGIWLICGYAYLWCCGSNASLYESLVLGLILGFLLPAAAILLSAALMQALFTDPRSIAATFQMVGFVGLARGGLMELPFGLLGGWLFWRIAARPTTAAMATGVMAITEMPFHRRWQDLSKRRLFCGLMAAGGPWTLANITYALIDIPPSELGVALALVLPLTEIWFVALGFAYLFAVSRRRGGIARKDCLLLGTLLTCTYPAFAVGFSLALGVVPAGIPPDMGFVGGTFAMALFGLSIIPFGLLSGWLFWRVGVRLARPKDVADAPVFD